MNNQKYCPNCQTLNDISAKNCSECDFEFVIVEKVDEAVSTNTKVFNDPVPLWVWSLISFFCPVAGLVFFIVWRHKWPDRARKAGRMALTVTIVLVVIGIIALLLYIGKLNGDVV